MVSRTVLFVVGLIFCGACLAGELSRNAADFSHFERKVRPLLVEHCYECHSSQSKTVHGGLRLDSSDALQQGGDSGPSIDIANPAASLLLAAVRYEGDIQMPPNGPLPASAISELTAWVEQGAPIPPAVDVPQRLKATIDFERGRRFWSFQPLKPQPLPAVRNSSWPKVRMDHFVLSAMERVGLEPSPPADRATLIRRLSFDLLGLPPTPHQVEQFVHDESPLAYEALVDRLLLSPHYGEKWGRMWLDMARYTDKTASWLNSGGEAYLYRDWVIQAFNQDMPYDAFIHRQLATDLMAETGPDDLPALGFLGLSPTYWKELKLPCEIINTIVADEWEERVDVVSRTFLGLTVACARCHDHKFDPISSEDYYALAGVFASCRQVERPLIADDKYQPVRRAKQEVQRLEAEIAKLQKQEQSPVEQIEQLQTQIASLKASTPHYDVPLASAISEESLRVVRAGEHPQDGTRLEYRSEPQDLALFIRGNPNRPGPIVPRGFLTVLSKPSATSPQRIEFHSGSGRLELAQAITTNAAALAARVLVNRIWLGHFGRGLVSTPSNFGRQGSSPSHPELLDDLAARFMSDGWSMRRVHREILLSATYRQASLHDAHKASIDPDNRWLARMRRQRLDFEAWRDAILAATGALDPKLGGPSVELDAAENHRRTIYATVHRREMSTTLMIHDFPDPNQHSPMRSSTTTPLQGLYALNGPLLTKHASRFAQRLVAELPDDAARIDRAYWLLYARAPSLTEMELGLSFLGDSMDHVRQQLWEQYAHVLLASNELLYVD